MNWIFIFGWLCCGVIPTVVFVKNYFQTEFKNHDLADSVKILHIIFLIFISLFIIAGGMVSLLVYIVFLAYAYLDYNV